MPYCAPLAPTAGFVTRAIDYVDCQAQTIGSEGYRALAAPGSTLSLTLVGLLTLFVALFGYRLLFGQVPSVRDGVVALLKIGFVLALATAWTPYRTLVYDVALVGPAGLAADIGAPAGLPGADGTLVERLDGADRGFVALARLGPGPAEPASMTPAAEPGQPALPSQADQSAQGFDSLALGAARVVYLVGAVGAIAAVRIVAGLMLALGPFFIAFLLFDATRGLFEGWVRVLGGAALGALGIAVALGAELAMIEPWLADLIARRTAGQSIPGAGVELFAMVTVFALALLAVLIGAARVAHGLRLPAAWREAAARVGARPAGEPVRIPAFAGGAEAASADRSRAAVIADAVDASRRREIRAGTIVEAAAAPGSAQPDVRQGSGRERPATAAAAQALGQGYRRRSRPRHSAMSSRRDARA